MLTPELIAGLAALEAPALREFAKAHDIKVTMLPNVRAETLRKQITEALEAMPPVPTPDVAEEPLAQPEPPVDPEPDPEPEPELDDELEDEAPVITREEIDAGLAELGAQLIPMSHPDNGSCDRYETDEDGNILVPATEAAAMFDHGFVVASKDA